LLRAQTWRDQRERRFLIERDLAPRILDTLAAVLPLTRYQPDADGAIVVTTYLDSADRHYLSLAEQGPTGNTVKLRIREYMWQPDTADGTAPVAYVERCFLERKQRQGDVRLKQRVQIPKTDALAIVRGALAVPGASPEALAIQAEIQARPLTPVMVSAYQRQVFGDDGSLRVTFDQRIGFYRPPANLYRDHPALTPDVLGPAVARGPSRVLEVKQHAGAATPDWLLELLSDLPSAADYSKFRDGMHALADADGTPVELSQLIKMRR
jgi:hypothetical protein